MAYKLKPDRYLTVSRRPEHWNKHLRDLLAVHRSV